MTAGDRGSPVLPAARIARIRKGEASAAARLVGARYICLGEKDLEVFYDCRCLRDVMEAVRRTDPSLVLTHSPQDYMLDHETASRLCQTACFGALAPNDSTGARHPAKAERAVPHLYYAQPFGGKDIPGEGVRPSLY